MKYTFADYQTMLKEVREKTDFVPVLGLVLGSGLDDFLKQVKVVCEIDYASLTKHPVTTNKAHKGRYILGTYQGVNLVIMEGRLHYYEGYSAEEVVVPIRLMKLMGIKKLIITNACGGISYGPGTLMLISDHISTQVPSPLIGENAEEFGPRFPDMTDPWDDRDRKAIFIKAKDQGLPIGEGVYMQFTGPQFETKAEIQMAEKAGADAVGMSTVIDNIAANHCGLVTLGIATIANWACGKTPGKLDDKDVLVASKKIAPAFSKLLKIAIEEMMSHD